MTRHSGSRGYRQHVFLSAYACHPSEGSEPGVGWHILLGALGIAERVTILTRVNNVPSILGALREDDRARCTVVGHDLPHLLQRIKKRVPGGTQAYYWLWQVTARRLVRSLHRQAPFSVAHHATFAVDWAPTAITSLPKSVGKVWGPVGGSTLCPLPLLKYLGLRGLLSEALRVPVGILGRATVGRVNARSADVVIGQNNDEVRTLARHARRFEVEPNAFIDVSMLPAPSDAKREENVLVGVGRLLPLKGWALAIQTLAVLPDSYRLTVFGDGPDRRRLMRLTRKLKLQDRVSFPGHRPRREMLETVARARCLVFPSLHDSAPAAVAEAVAIGTPVVALGLGGTREILELSSRGTVVDPKSSNVALAFANAILDCQQEEPSSRWDASRVSELLSAWYVCSMERSL